MLLVFAIGLLIGHIHGFGLDLDQIWYVDDSVIDIPLRVSVL